MRPHRAQQREDSFIHRVWRRLDDAFMKPLFGGSRPRGDTETVEMFAPGAQPRPAVATSNPR